MAKRIIFNEIRRNKLLSYLLILSFLALVFGLGLLLGLVLGDIIIGGVISLVVGIIYALIAYFSGKNMVLAMSGAKPVTKKEYPHLYHSVEGLAIAAGIPTPKAYVIDDPSPNAFATGRNPKEGVVVVTTGLLDILNRQELEGVLAHEIAHIKNFDIRVSMIAAVMVGIIVFLSHMLIRSFFFSNNRNRDGRAMIFVVIISIVFAILAPIVGEIIKLAISRKREYAADAQGARLTRYPQGLADALKKIQTHHGELRKANNATAHMFIHTPFTKKKRFLGGLFSTHPPTEERIKRLESM